ncbi:ATPase, T2SS/T4P/T4SS family [Rhizobium sp. BK176]|uniref:ATPase, T2SS/T4P/T4SS family n=1 Tax=Rhizobium sp. BK176 TaxID=2587071 RepID=UPI002166CAED|nr:ATPase, T2SS/T4P/T4SS family [Rhizobium sp. BK176]MCS4089524.1 Tfp pilus assembly pilus retraction ATPase PilT [Rhizobium sp. BK176]
MQDSNLEERNGEVFLTNFPFTDLYIRLDVEGSPSRFRPDITRIPRERYQEGIFEVPPRYEEHMNAIRELVNEMGGDEGTVTYQGMRLRYASFESDGEPWSALRGTPLEIRKFDELGLHPQFVQKMKSMAKKKGLIIVGGKTGDGKTTTCVSLLKYFLDKHGGLLFTAEDPPEFAISGAVNERAFCLQYKVRDNDDWARAAKAAMRSRPDYILFGEIRTPEAAENLLKTLTSGHLVVATIHAGQVSDTIAALMQLAEHKLGKVARDSLADRLLAAVHQTMTADGPEIKCIVPGSGSLNETERAQMIETIKSGNLDNLGKAVEFFPAARSAAAQRKR